MRPSLMVSGIQLMRRLYSMSRSRMAVILMNQLCAGVIDQGGVAAPAEGIAMLKLRRRKQQARFLQVVENQLVRVLYEDAVPGGAAAHIAPGIHQLDKGHVVFLAHPGVVLAEGRGVMDDAGAVGGGDVVVGDHVVAPLAGFGAGGPGAGEQGLIMPGPPASLPGNTSRISARPRPIRFPPAPGPG